MSDINKSFEKFPGDIREAALRVYEERVAALIGSGGKPEEQKTSAEQLAEVVVAGFSKLLNQ